jgi:hypothetical protein
MSVGRSVCSAPLVILLTMVGLTSGSCQQSAVAPTPPSPTAANLAGSWLGSLRSTGAGPIGLGDWSRLRLTLQPSGGDELVTNDGQRFSINDTVLGDQRILGLVLTPHDSCVSVSLVITSVQVDNAGATQAFSGSMSGRWCNTLVGTFTFTKG